MPRYSAALNALVETMLSPDPLNRPSATEILHNGVLQRNRVSGQSKEDLRRELKTSMEEAARLRKQLDALQQPHSGSVPSPADAQESQAVAGGAVGGKNFKALPPARSLKNRSSSVSW